MRSRPTWCVPRLPTRVTESNVPRCSRIPWKSALLKWLSAVRGAVSVAARQRCAFVGVP
jgi:NhaP-type Na+/H+ or K+/H+ antiporter